MFPTVAETLDKVHSCGRELCWRQLGLKPRKPYLFHVQWSVCILFEQTLYISLQSPQKIISEHRLSSYKSESNDDRMDKNSLMYTAVTKLTKYQNTRTGSLITTYRSVEITWGACKCKSHTPSYAESKACLVEWKWYPRHDKCTRQMCRQTCRSHFHSSAAVFSVDRKKFDIQVTKHRDKFL